jgi:hypothetical protein
MRAEHHFSTRAAVGHRAAAQAAREQRRGEGQLSAGRITLVKPAGRKRHDGEKHREGPLASRPKTRGGRDQRFEIDRSSHNPVAQSA